MTPARRRGRGPAAPPPRGPPSGARASSPGPAGAEPLAPGTVGPLPPAAARLGAGPAARRAAARARRARSSRRAPLLAPPRAARRGALVDRMVRGRAWIACIGVLLVGLVATQVSLLKLNSGIGGGRALGTSSSAPTACCAPRSRGCPAPGERSGSGAALGMVMPPARSLLPARRGRARGARRRPLQPGQSIALPRRR